MLMFSMGLWSNLKSPAGIFQEINGVRLTIPSAYDQISMNVLFASNSISFLNLSLPQQALCRCEE